MTDITFDYAAYGRQGFSGSFSYNHIVGSNARLFAVSDVNVSAITCGGVSMQLYDTYTPIFPPGTNNIPLKIWYLPNPTPGTQTMFVTCGGAATVCSASYIAPDEVAIEAFSEENSSNNQVSTWPPSVTTIKDRSWVITFAGNPNASSSQLAAGTDTTQRVNAWADIGTQGIAILDSNGPVTPAGSKQLNINVLNAANNPTSDFVTSYTISIRTFPEISVSDSITIVDSPNMEKVYNLSVSDSITISESVNGEKTFDIFVSDSIVTSESLTVENPELGGIVVSESIVITEYVDGDYYPSILSGYEEMSSMEDNSPLGMDDLTML